jgi:putative iron-dependent peroxidase
LFAGPRPAELHPFGRWPARGTPPRPRPATCSSTSGRGGWTCASSSPGSWSGARRRGERAGRGARLQVLRRARPARLRRRHREPGRRAALAAALITDEADPGVRRRQLCHRAEIRARLAAWNRLPVEEQERVIGRTKLDNVELADEVKPADSHVALNTIVDENGEERQIVRDNMPFGRVGTGEFGTYFIGYSATPEVTEQMLRNMFLGDIPGRTDRILEFSTAVTGTLFFVPSADFLDDPPALPGAVTRTAAAPEPPLSAVTVVSDVSAASPDAQPAEPAAANPADGSLGIGSLNRTRSPRREQPASRSRPDLRRGVGRSGVRGPADLRAALGRRAAWSTCSARRARPSRPSAPGT